jgi:hypothetical protein
VAVSVRRHHLPGAEAGWATLDKDGTRAPCNNKIGPALTITL